MNQRDEDFLESVAKPLCAPVRASDGFESRVMAAVRTPERSNVLAWVVRPRVLRLSPLAGLAAAAGIALAALSLDRVGSGSEQPQVAAVRATAAVASVDTVQLVQFMLVAPNAQTVSVVGDFNDWDSAATPLRENADAGVWTITVPLTPGRHQYVFMVNGNRWTPDPAAPLAVEDSFGMPNSVITVGESAS